MFIAIIIACFFAMNIGASGTAAAMGAAYGAGAIKRRIMAVFLVGIVAMLGALLGGGEVTKTISSGIIPEEVMTISLTIVVIASAGLTLYVSNKMGIPLSTSEVTVGSLVGVGLVYQKLYVWQICNILIIWITLPFIAYFIAKFIGKKVAWLEKQFLNRHMNKSLVKRILVVMLIFFGCYEAFAAGMNNVANAIGPLISAKVITEQNGLLLGAVFMCIGAILLGGPVLETNGKKITKLSLLQGSTVSFTSGSLVIIASLLGIPVPLTQTTTMSIIGVGASHEPIHIWRQQVVKRIILVWILSPITALITSFTLVHLFILSNPYPLMFLIICFFCIETLRLKERSRQLV